MSYIPSSLYLSKCIYKILDFQIKTSGSSNKTFKEIKIEKAKKLTNNSLTSSVKKHVYSFSKN